MTDESALTSDISKQSNALPGANDPSLEDITRILEDKHGRIAGITDIRVEIKDLEGKETSFISGISRTAKNYAMMILGLNEDPAVYSQMTETLNGYRRILESGEADGYNDVSSKKAA